jgi:hypothetical protein
MEIFQNTLLKLVFRQGTNLDRKKIKLSLGEPAFTNDTFRFFVGTGTLSGGKLAGNLFQGSSTDITTFTTSEVGDQAFNTNNSTLYRLQSSNAIALSAWQPIGGIYSSGDSYINVNSLNKLSLNPLSSNMISNDLVKGPIILDSGRIGLSSNIPFVSVSTKTITVSSGLKAYIGSTDVTNTAVNALSSNLNIQSNQIFARYNGNTSTLTYHRGITSSSRLSAGHYKFTFATIGTNYVPSTQIIGTSAIGFFARPVNLTLSSCDVMILSGSDPKIDTDFTLSINY